MPPINTIPSVQINTTGLILTSNLLGREVTCQLYLPEMENVVEPLHLLLLNDGQDLPKMGYPAILKNLFERKKLRPFLTVGITAGERMQEYGLSIQPDFKGRGAKALLYRQFIVEELLPAIAENTGIESFASTSIGGFSLGALSALDIAWHHPDIFSQAGCFSGSFWWRSKDLSEGYTPDHRLTHKMVSETEEKPALKFWFQVGTKD